MAGKKASSDKIKKIALAVLGAAFVLVFVKQLFFSSSPPRPRLSPDAAARQQSAVSGASAAQEQTPTRSTGKPRDKETQLQSLMADTSPLDFSLLTASTKASEVSRNIFDFKPPPLPPEPKPSPPPPIGIQYLQPQAAVAGTPREFTLMVFGRSFPPDAQIVLGGSPKPTKRVNDSQLSTMMVAAEYASPRSIPVEVKSQSEPSKFYSNQIPLMIQQAPPPPFKFVGRIGDIGVFEMMGANGQREYLRLRRSDTIQSVWRIDNISDSGVDLTDTRYDIKRRIALEERRSQ